jgi:hypothetical protein
MRSLRIVLGAVLAAGLLSACAQPSIEGKWKGSLSVMGRPLPLEFDFTKDKNGVYQGTLHSPNQTKVAIKTDSVTFKDRTVTATVGTIGGSFTGKLDDSGKAINGTWKQMTASLPLTLTRQ